MKPVPKHLIGIIAGIFTCSLSFAVGFGLDSAVTDLSVFSEGRLLQQIEPVDEPDDLSLKPIVANEPTVVESLPDREAVYGWYSYDGPDSLKDASLIAINEDFDLDDDGKAKTSLYAGVFTRFENFGDQGHIDADWVKLDGNEVSFKTKKISGFEFQFMGKFFKNRTAGEEGEKLLRGTLTQYRKGKKVAEVSGDLSYYEPQCWH